MIKRSVSFHVRLLCGAAVVAIAAAGTAQAQDRVHIHIEPQPLVSALNEFGVKTGQPVISTPELTASKLSPGVKDADDPAVALAQLLTGTGLSYRCSGDTYLIVRSPESGPAPKRCIAADGAGGSDGADGTVAALVVTAQKKEENIQDVPIAISAFTEKSLEEQKIEGGFDLLKAVPNVTFSKNNFSGYNFSIRGIGTKAVSVTTDPGVAVEFNETPLIRNRLFEQEYFDVERVEVLRGPQGTLHGRNATSGVIDLISAKPNLREFSGSIKGEVGNYDTKRMVGMLNVPVLNDMLGIRLAGSSTIRKGYGINLYNNSDVDGRDLWSGRLTIGYQPIERVRADLIWERFHEDDNRQRTGKQLCKHDPGLAYLGDVLVQPGGLTDLATIQGAFSQGCLPGSLYDDSAFGTPNGFAIPFISALAEINTGTVGSGPDGLINAIQRGVDPYGDTTQSRDLRALYSQIPSRYKADADIIELNIRFDISDDLTVSSLTAYDKDKYYSTQDFNRYTTLPAFTDTTGPYINPRYRDLMRGGIFCDPQLGCSDTIVGQDLSRARSAQFSQELRLQSKFDGPVNFSLGANYTRYHTVEDYYVFFNGITLASIVSLNSALLLGEPAQPDRATLRPDCSPRSTDFFHIICVPIENNSISQLQDIGHNYFLSRNPYRLNSTAAFGEVYWKPADDLKVTLGLRYTDDRKVFTPIPSETVLSPESYQNAFDPVFTPKLKGLPLLGLGYGYPALPDEKRRWGEWTGRFGFDLKLHPAFADETMVYAFYSRGYKAGGMNPPPPGLDYAAAKAAGIVYPASAPREFRPEFVNAYEVGAKNNLFGGGMTANASAFFYDYKDYQVSKIVDRSANNENFDAKIWGLEFESIFAPSRDLQLRASVGYLDTAIAKGSRSIDIMNRTAGHTDWVVVKPAVTLMSNCIIPLWVAQDIMSEPATRYPDYFSAACPGGSTLGGTYSQTAGVFNTSLPSGRYYDPADHPEANYGGGFYTDISGNELPNAPHWTVTLGGQYAIHFGEKWTATVRGDAYWQSQSWARVYNLNPYDKLHGWYNVNASIWLEDGEGLKIELYAKNLLNKTPITDAFLNSDDAALTTNIFTLDPRLIGFSVRKEF